MRSLDAAGIEALDFRAKADAGNAQRQHILLLPGGELSLQPDETRPAPELVVGLLVIEFGQHAGKLFHGFVRIHDPPWLGIERRHAHVSRQQGAVAVDDVGSCRSDRLRQRVRHRRRGQTVEHQARADDAVDRRKGHHRDRHAPAAALALAIHLGFPLAWP